MPGKVKVKILAGRNLPVMDRSSDTTDAYVEIKLGNTTYKTDVCRKSLNPQWNSEWYRFEVDDSELQDEPLQIRLMDHDTYSANDAIGKVYLNLNPLLIPAVGLPPKYGWSGESNLAEQRPSSSVLSGWVPVYDTMHGIRGEVNVTVKVELFSDFNKFRQSSCGVQFFCSPIIPHGYLAQVIHGFVEELVVNDDPEYQWIDKIRTPRASNEARQTLFFKLSGELQRKIGVKALDLGGNAVIGYNQCFDLEGESGIVARGIGTVVTLLKQHHENQQQIDAGIAEERAIGYLNFLAYSNGLKLNEIQELDSFAKSECASNNIISSVVPLIDTSLQTQHSLSNQKFLRQFSQPVSDQSASSKQAQIRTSASTKSLTDDIMKEIVLERLLQQEDERGYVSNNKLSRKIKNLKSSSHSLITKKMFEIKSRLSDSNMQEIDSKKIPKPTRSSLIDLRDLRKKKKSQIRNNSCMAELLVRSVITADTNLGCIAEGHDPIASTSSASESHDKFDVSESEIPATVKSDSCVSIINKTISEPYLFIKDRQAVTQLSNADSSSSESSSSDDDVSENLSDVKEDDKIDFDTVSLIVKNVTENNAQDKASKDFNFTYLDLNVVNTPEVQVCAENNDNPQRTISLTLDNPNKIGELFLSHVLNTNEFCYSAPTDIDKKSDNVFVFPTCSENKIEELMHSSILKDTFNENIRSKSCEDVSLFPVETQQVDVEHQSLMKTAMQTMLLEKVNLMAPHSPPPLQQSEECPRFPSTSPKHSGHKSLLNVIKDKYKTLKIKPPKPAFVRQFLNKHKDLIKHKEKQPGLVESAMNTILMDKVNNLKGILLTAETNKKSKDKNEEKPLKNISELDEKPDPCSVTTNIENSNNNEPISESVEKSPNINLRLDNGTILKPNNLANSNTNAEHAPCFYPFVRRIVESPVMEKDITREKHGHQRTESTGGKMSQSPARLNAIPCIHRRSSDSDLSITPKGNSLTGSDRSSGNIPHGYYHMRNTIFRPTVDNFDMMEYPFLTMTKYPPGFILHLGGAVSARSVKLLERITNIEEPETRDTWWSELRMEIRSHARALNCNSVLGYTEQTSICDEVCVLSASGTAAVIAVHNSELSDGVSGLPNLHKPHIPGKDIMTNSLDRTDFERENKSTKPVENVTANKIPQAPESPEQETNIEFPSVSTSCRICHVPYNESSVSFRVNMQYCSTCKVAKVPDILLATIEIPEGMPINGRGCFLQSYVCRSKRDLKGELNAKEISESLPFLEYELHRLLVNKMKVKGMNTIFGLRVRITIGEKLLVGIATGTAIYLLPLPPPPLPKLVASNSTGTDDKKLSEMQKLLVDTVKKNKEVYEVKLTQDQDISQGNKTVSDTDESDEEKGTLDLGVGNKDSCVLEIDDSEDIEVISLLIEPRPPDGFHVVNTETVPGLEDLEIVKNLQMFTQIWRTKIPLTQTPSHFGKTFQKLLQSIYFKLRRMIPCALCDLQFRIDLPEPDEIQLSLLGMALGLGDPMKTLSKYKRKNLCHLPPKEYLKKSDDEMIFSLEDDHIPENSIPTVSQGNLLSTQMPKHRQKSPQRLRVNTKQRHTPIKERHGVDITPLSYVPGGKIERYLGYLNFFFIRETTSIREGGGLSGFVHSFITEVLAIVRAHVTALGGNAMVAYFMTECVLYHNAHKNQGQCLINVGGDVVFVSYYTEDV